ncbi:MAG: hypothetical protein WAL24_09570 [Nitrososphaeraceae archaeon]
MTEITTITGSESISISKIPSKYLRCPTDNKPINYEIVKNILMDALARNTRPFSPSDPVILSETEVYCNTDCYAIAVVREELEED